MIFNDFQALTVKDKNSLILSKLNRVFIYAIDTGAIEEVYRFKSDFRTLISGISPVFRRLLRKDIRYAFPIEDKFLLIIKDKQIFRFDTSSMRIIGKVPIPRGSRPLNITKISSLKGFSNGIYFGEYFSNPEKKAVKIYQYLSDSLKEVYEFPSGTINHIHNLIVDYFRECLWILTGDLGESAAIYQATRDFQSVRCILRGEQKFRSCVAFPTKEGLLYATDSQFEHNSIRLLFKKSGFWTTNTVFNINGPSIYGTKIGEIFFFSTSVEGINSGNLIKKFLRNTRGPGIIKNQSEIVCGSVQTGFKTIYSNKKDNLPFLLFQFGNILFPSGDNLISKLFFTNIALEKNDFSTIIFDI